MELLMAKFNLGIKTYSLFQKQDKTANKFSKSIIIPAKMKKKI